MSFRDVLTFWFPFIDAISKLLRPGLFYGFHHIRDYVKGLNNSDVDSYREYSCTNIFIFQNMKYVKGQITLMGTDIGKIAKSFHFQKYIWKNSFILITDYIGSKSFCVVVGGNFQIQH